MIGVTAAKGGVLFIRIAPGGFRILSAIDQVAASLSLNLFITSGTDGEHSGPSDPHHRGEAYDVRSHGFAVEVKQAILDGVMGLLGTEHFYGFLEAVGTANEHFHFQVRKGTTYPAGSRGGVTYAADQ